MSAHAFLVEKVNQTSRTDLSGKSLCCIFGSPCRRRRNRGGHKVSLRDPKKGCSLLASWVVRALASKQGRDVNDRHPPPLFWSHFNVQLFIIHLAYSSLLKFLVVRLSWASRAADKYTSPLLFPHLHHRPSFVAFSVVGSALVAQTIGGVTTPYNTKAQVGSDARQCRVILG